MKLNWLKNVIPFEVSYVDKPAIDKRFIALKNIEIKSAISFRRTSPLPEATTWDAGIQVGKAEPKDLKIMCAWYDSSEPDKKGSYKLPHHRCGNGYPVVWNGVKAAMGALMGARGGVDIPDADRKGVYNHLAKHYKQWDKDVPEFKTIDELEKPFLDRVANKIKNKLGFVDTKLGRVLSKSNEDKLLEVANTIVKAGEMIQKVLSSVNKNLEEDLEMKEEDVKKLISDKIKEELDIFEKNLEAKLKKYLSDEESEEYVEDEEEESEEENKEDKDEEVEEEESDEEDKEKNVKKDKKKKKVSKEKSLLSEITKVVEKKFKEIKSEVDGIKEELHIKPESDKKKINEEDKGKKSEDEESDFTGVFGIKNI